MLNQSLITASWHAWIAGQLPRVGPWWLNLVWTVLFSAALAVGFTVFGFAAYAGGDGAWRNLSGWWHWYQLNFFVALVIGLLIHGLFSLALRWMGAPRLRRLAGPRRALFYAGIPLLGVAIGWPLSLRLLGQEVGRWYAPENANMIFGSALIALLITFVVYQIFEARARQLDAERRATEGQLRLLQAQIEPHFLFNTLANVLSLIEADPPRARRMLESFTDYLRASLGGLRQDEVLLEAELQLSQAYLQVMQLRMDERLHFSIEADASARAVRVPPLLLQPLIENAIRHGLEPKLDGGMVRVRALLQAGQLRLSVEDDGLGLDHPATGGNGMATANIRSRLQSRYGDGATLIIERLQPGTRALLSLPVEAT